MEVEVYTCSDCGKEITSPDDRNECESCSKIVCKSCACEKTAEGMVILVCSDCHEEK